MKPRTLICLWALLFTGCEDLFQERVPMNTDGGASLADLFAREEEEAGQLLPPAQVYVSDGLFPQEIRLSWSPVNGAASYFIERAAVEPGAQIDPVNGPGDEYFDILEPFVTGTSYTDASILDEVPRPDSPEYRNRYYYRIYAENAEKNIESSPPSAAAAGALFPPPGNVKASLGKSIDYIRVEWTKMARANSYWVYRSDNEHGTGSYFIGSVAGNQNWLVNEITESEQGRDYYYSVVGRSAAGTESIFSFLAMGYALVEGAPEAPEDARRAQGSGLGNETNKIEIEWNAPGGGDDFFYAVYRYTSEDATLRLLSGSTNNTYFVDNRQLTPGIYYYYQVQSMVRDENGAVIKGPVSDPVKAFILSPPDTIIAEKSNSGVSLKWLPALNVDEEFGGIQPVKYDYMVCGSGDYAGPYTEISGEAPEGADGYFRMDISSGNDSFFKVKTLNGAEESAFSAVVAPSPAAAVIRDVSKAANIPNYQANASGVYPVRVTWKKPDEETPHAYHIYRSTNQDSGFRKITGEPVYADTEADGIFTFVDTTNQTAKPGKRYYYKVLSLNRLGQGSYYSEPLAGYGALTYEQYMLEYNKTVKSSHKKMTYMNKPGATDKLGSETKTGTISGSIAYNAGLAGLRARIVIRYDNYADFYTEGSSALGPYFVLTGNSNTTAEMDQSGKMDGTITASGMYPGKVYYDNVQIKGGAAGGGTYGIEPDGFPRSEINWTIGER
jgi:fibronectin type 3 domain-containing protein